MIVLRYIFTPFVQSSFFVLSSSHNALPNYSCVLVIERSATLFSNEDSGLESDAPDNSENLRTEEVSVSVEPTFQEQITTEYSRDEKMRHIIQRIKRNPKLQDLYFWNAQEEKLYFLSDGVGRLCIP